MKKFNIILLILVCFFTSGCSLLKIASSPFKSTISKVPEKISKSEKTIRCKGEIILDEFGRVVKCGKNYYSYETNSNIEERRLNFREKLAQFVLNAQGYLLWGFILCVVLTLSGFGWVISGVFSVIRGTGRVAKDLVTGISSAKKYIKNNGNRYSDTEKQAYQQALNDMMDKISSSISNKESKKLINKLRAEVDDN